MSDQAELPEMQDDDAPELVPHTIEDERARPGAADGSVEHAFDFPENELTISNDGFPSRPVMLKLRSQDHAAWTRFQTMSVRDALDLATAIKQVAAASPRCCTWCGKPDGPFWIAPNDAACICIPCICIPCIGEGAEAIYLAIEGEPDAA